MSQTSPSLRFLVLTPDTEALRTYTPPQTQATVRDAAEAHAALAHWSIGSAIKVYNGDLSDAFDVATQYAVSTPPDGSGLLIIVTGLFRTLNDLLTTQNLRNVHAGLLLMIPADSGYGQNLVGMLAEAMDGNVKVVTVQELQDNDQRMKILAPWLASPQYRATSHG